MSNVVIAKIEFEVPTEVRAQEIYDTIRVGNEFVFATVDPPSFDIYCDAMGQEVNKIFPLEEACHEMATEMWFDSYKKCEISELEWLGGNTASFKFYTFWDVPYIVLLGFGNKFKVPFTLKHVRKHSLDWGIEKFELDENDRIRRTSERVCMEVEYRNLHIELMGYAPTRGIDLLGYEPKQFRIASEPKLLVVPDDKDLSEQSALGVLLVG